ncbi:MAG: hypothetical protein ABEN55_03780 [Bradymonadaceae bacterium]
MGRYADRLEDVHVDRVEIKIQPHPPGCGSIYCDVCGEKRGVDTSSVTLFRRIYYRLDRSDRHQREWVERTNCCPDCTIELQYGTTDSRTKGEPVSAEHHRLLADQRDANLD